MRRARKRRGPACSDTPTRTELGLEPRALQATLAETVRWLADTGNADATQAGRLPAA
jgi:hypothetical protein